MKVVRLSAPRSSRIYPPGNIPGTHFCWRLSQIQGNNAAGRIMSPSEIEPVTLRVVAQCVNQLRHWVAQQIIQRLKAVLTVGQTTVILEANR